MKKSFLLLILTFPGLIIMSFALHTNTAHASFNSNNLMDDIVFTNVNSMSESAVQGFLNHWPSGCLTNYQAPYPIDYFTYGGNVSAASVIYRAAQYWGLNPQVILATLQKESSVVTGDASYGCQYINTAMGYDCPDVGHCPQDASELGFSQQVMKAAWQLRFNQERSYGNISWDGDNIVIYHGYMTQGNRARTQGGSVVYYDGTATIDGTAVYMSNGATASLYSYTPHFHGNQNFVSLFESWFGPTAIASPVYIGTTTGREFLLFNGVKYYIPSFDVMIDWGLHRYAPYGLSDAYLDNLPSGSDLSSLAKMSDDPNSPLFLLDDGKRYPVPISACLTDLDGVVNPNTSWGLDCFNTEVSKAYPSAMMQQITAQDITLPQMIAYGDSVWKLEGGKKRRIVDSLIINVLGGWGQVRWMKDSNAQQPIGKMLMRNGYVVRFSGSAQVYLYDDGKLYTVPSPTDMVNWGLDKQGINDFPASYNSSDPLPTGPNITQVGEDASGNLYLVDKDYKMPFGSDAAQWPTGAPTVAPGELGVLTTIPLSNVYLSDLGQIFSVYGSKTYVFPTMDDFFALGYSTTTIRRVSSSVQNLRGLTYAGMHMASGRLYKINNNLNQIYMVNGSNSLYVNSINYPGLPYEKTINVDPITATRYPVNGTYSP